jgi:hypothetical protein
VCRLSGELRLVLSVLGAVATGACATDPTVFHVGCQQITSVDAGAGLTPSIGWSPDCRVATLGVYEAVPLPPDGGDQVPPLPGDIPGFRPGNTLWRIDSPDAAGNWLEPSIRYGHVPQGAHEVTPAAPLVAGQRYIVVLEAASPDGSFARRHWSGLFQP